LEVLHGIFFLDYFPAYVVGSGTSNNGIQTFSFQASSALFQVPLDTSATFTVIVKGTVSYLGGKKRSVEAIYGAVAQSQTQISQAQFVLTTSDAVKAPNSMLLYLISAVLLAILI
jgi:hypothetical protein